MIEEAIIEELSHTSMNSDWSDRLKERVFYNITGLPETVEINRASILWTKIDVAVEPLLDVEDVDDLRKELRDDILETYDNRQHWDLELIKKHIANNSPSERYTDVLVEAIIERLETVD